MLLNVEKVTKTFKDVTILKEVSLRVENKARIGLLGPNGAGKTTLLNLIAGDLEPDEGQIIRAKNLEIGYLRQNDALVGSRTLQEEAQDAFAKVYALRDELARVGEQLAAAPQDVDLLARYDRLQAAFEARDGYHLEDKTNRVLNGLGFGSFPRDTLVGKLSGGEKMRFAFAKMLLREPELLMLDEPTNHLDFTMLTWLESYLESYKGAVLVVSHDRYFLDAVAKDICEVENTHLESYHGGYSSFVVQKAERQKTAARAYEKQQDEIAKLEDYVRRNMVRASTANMAKSRQKQLDKMEKLERPVTQSKDIAIHFDYDTEPFSEVLLVEGLGVSVGDGAERRTLYENLQLRIKRDEKIALVGLNGVGKSTFLKAIQDLMDHKGLARWGGNVRLGYFDQELSNLPLDETVLEAVHSQFPSKTEFEIRSVLGRLLLEGETVFKKVRELSGAMRAKVAFAILEMRRANVLLLDEPTNHLDYRAKEVLEKELMRFSGTLLAVSHDRYFLKQVPHAILEMRPDGFYRYEGNYDAYADKKQAEQQRQAEQEASNTPPKAEKATGGKRTRQQRAQQAQRRTRIAALEKEIERLEEEIAQTNAALSDEKNASDYEKLAALSEKLKEDNQLLDDVTEEWLMLSAEEE